MSEQRFYTRLMIEGLTAVGVSAVLVSIQLAAQQPAATKPPASKVAAARPAAADQWTGYQQNSNFSPLTQITPGNVSRLTKAWVFSYGGGSQPSGSLGLDYRFEVQPLIIGGVMYLLDAGVSLQREGLFDRHGTRARNRQGALAVHVRRAAFTGADSPTGRGAGRSAPASTSRPIRAT